MRQWTLLIAAVTAVLTVDSAAQATPYSPHYQLISDGVISGGETCGDGHARVAASAIGEPITNDVATASFKLSEGHFVTQRHLLLLLPHRAPTINPVTSPTAVASQTLTGTKAPDTSVWLNGLQIVPLNADTTWSDPLTLVEGTNVLNLLTKDVFGNASATITTAIVLDTSPPIVPVVTDDGTSTAIFTQLHATWSSSDPGSGLAEFEYRIGATPTGSEVVPPTGTGLATELTKTGLMLIQGQRYYLAVRAKNGAGTWSEWGISDGIYANGTAPAISFFAPSDGSKRYAGDLLTLSASAADADGDALEYQFGSNSLIKQAWSTPNALSWLTVMGDIGLNTIKVEVRDGHGGVTTRQQEIYLLRKPIPPP